MTPIEAFGWKNEGPPDIDAENLELARQQEGAYAEQQATAARTAAEAASDPTGSASTAESKAITAAATKANAAQAAAEEASISITVPVEVGCAAPTAVAATDTANVKATLKAAGEAKGLAVFNKGGVYSINQELTRPAGSSVYIGAGTTLRAVAGFAGTCLLTDSAATKEKDQSIIGGGTLDSNKLVAHALWCRYFQRMVLGVSCKNSLEDDVILGSEEAAGSSVEPILTAGFIVRREYTATSKGFSCVNAVRASDGRAYGNSLSGQETGLKLGPSSGGWRTFGLHPIGSGATFQPMQVCIDDGASNNEHFGVNADTPTPKLHAGATGSNASVTITDTEILANHLRRPVSGTNIPAGCYIGTVTPGVSFTLVNIENIGVKPTGAVSGVTLAGVGVLVRSDSCYVSGDTYVSPTYGADNGCYGVVIAFGATNARVLGWTAKGGSASFRITQAIAGNLSAVTWGAITQINCTNRIAAWQPPSGGYSFTGTPEEIEPEILLLSEGVRWVWNVQSSGGALLNIKTGVGP